MSGYQQGIRVCLFRGECISGNGRIAEREEKFRFDNGKASQCDAFKKYGDLYQISGTYRTLASCSNEQGRYEDALHYLSEALGYVNRHHEKYYHCMDTMDRLRPYVPMATTSIELEWINDDGIKSVPEWIARFREQLSVTYAALGMKPQSDYNRHIYLDILDYTRQDKEL